MKSSMVNSFMHAIYRLRRKLYKKSKVINYTWRTVNKGPLEGLTLYLPELGDSGSGDEVVAGKYESEFLTLLEDLVKRRGCLFDIGAHIGIYTVAWIKLGGKAVQSFEPFATNTHIIEEALRRNNMTDLVRVHNLALGNFTGTGTLVAHQYDSSRSGIRELDQITLTNTAEKSTTSLCHIPVWKLDDLFYKQNLPIPSVIKIDVEGAEFNVLEGSKEVLMRCHPTLLVEVHNIINGVKIADYLNKLDYGLHILGSKGKKRSLLLCMWTPKQPS